MKFSLKLLALSLLYTIAVHPSWAALDLEGRSGIFLNSLAYPLADKTTEVSAHYVNLNNKIGDIWTVSAATGYKGIYEFGYTHLVSDVDGVKDQNIVNAKYLILKEKPNAPAVAVTAAFRSLDGGSSDLEGGVSATKIFLVGKLPLVTDLGARYTKAKSLGLFGFDGDYKVKLEGSTALFVTKNFAIGAEFKQQIGTRTWKDIAIRYVANKNINVDAGIADLGPGIDKQVALGATYSW